MYISGYDVLSFFLFIAISSCFSICVNHRITSKISITRLIFFNCWTGRAFLACRITLIRQETVERSKSFLAVVDIRKAIDELQQEDDT